MHELPEGVLLLLTLQQPVHVGISARDVLFLQLHCCILERAVVCSRALYRVVLAEDVLARRTEVLVEFHFIGCDFLL